MKRFERLTSALYASISLILFAWVLASPLVELSDMAGPFRDFTILAIKMWLAGAVGLVSIRLIFQSIAPQTAPRFEFLQNWFAVHRQNDMFLHVAISLAAFVVTMASFTTFKSVALPQLDYSWDMAFVHWDRWLFMGVDPWLITHSWLPSATHSWLLDKGYHAWFYPMFMAYVCCALLLRGPVVRACYLVTYLASWLIIGTILAAALISAGPAFDGLMFDSGQVFAPLMARLAEQDQALGGLQSQVLQQMLYAGYQDGTAALGYGISAMPSMHIALASMWMCLFWAIRWWFGLMGVLYVLLIWTGSVHLGWHYAADGLVSLPIVLALWLGFRALFKRYEPPQP